MSHTSRRKFLRELGFTVGALAVGTEMMSGFPPFQKQVKPFTRTRPDPKPAPIDYRYAPSDWRSLIAPPNDPWKSLVARNGDLLYGHPGPADPHGAFAEIVSWGFRDRSPGTYQSQKSESAAVPIITTTLAWSDLSVVLTHVATSDAAEGRVDTLLVTVTATGAAVSGLTPELRVASRNRYSSDNEDDAALARHEHGVATRETRPATVFFIVDAPVDHAERNGLHTFRLPKVDLAAGASTAYVVRFPQEGQPAARVAPGLARAQEIVAAARSLWQGWRPYEGKTNWNIAGPKADALVAASRTLDQCRLSREGKGSHLSGPTVSRHLPVMEGVFMAEAAMYLGKEREAHETIVALWDRQDERGAILPPAGESRSRDTSLAILALVRHAELTQNWTYFNEIYPDAYKGAAHLRELRNAALSDGTANGAYGLLQKGPGDYGLSGIRAEFSDTVLALAALRILLEVGDRYTLEKRSEIREFYGQLRAAFIAAAKREMRTHADGFKYLPMLLASDELWTATDPSMVPPPQASQIALSQALYPGLILPPGDPVVTGHLELMKASLREDVPAGTGWLGKDGIWNGNAPVAAQVFLWAGFPEIAHAIFVGYLNHASPLGAWHQEQTIAGAATPLFAGDMPQSWAAAECVRFLRHALVLEDEKTLRLFNGLAEADLAAGKPFALAATPTRWGRVSVTAEPVDAKTWRTTFTREPIDDADMPPLTNVTMPLRLPGNFQFDKFSGPSVVKNSPLALVDPTLLSWEVTWKNFRRS